MLAGTPADFTIRENLIDVGVENDVVDAAASTHEAIPGTGFEEGIVDHDSRLGVRSADVAPAVVIEFLHLVHIIAPICRLV